MVMTMMEKKMVTTLSALRVMVLTLIMNVTVDIEQNNDMHP